MQQEIFNLIAKFTGNANLIVIPKEIVKITGGYEAGALLSQIIYWSDKTKDGWIYKTYKDWEEELALSEHQIRKAKKKLEELGIIETKLKKANGVPVIHYKVKIERLINLLMPNLSKTSSNLKNFKNGILKNSRMESAKSSDSITETTTETTINNLYNIAENSAGLKNEISKNEKNKISGSNNKTENLTREDKAGGKNLKENASTFADEELKNLKKTLAHLYAYVYQKKTGLKYPSEEFGKLMKISEKVAKFLLKQLEDGIISDRQNLIFRVFTLLHFAFLRKKTDPVFIYGKFAECYAEMKEYQTDERQFYKQVFEKAYLEAKRDMGTAIEISKKCGFTT